MYICLMTFLPDIVIIFFNKDCQKGALMDVL